MAKKNAGKKRIRDTGSTRLSLAPLTPEEALKRAMGVPTDQPKKPERKKP